MATLRPQPRFRCQDTVARKVIGAQGSPAQETLGLLWRVAGLEESEDELSLSSEEEDDSIIDSSSPPEGHAQVAWLDKACFEQVKDQLVEAGHHGLDTASVDELRVVDRHLAVGDVVAHESDPLGQTAVVTAVHRLLDLELSDGRIFLQMPITSVAPVVPFFPDQYVVKSGWLGRIEEVLELVSVGMADGSIADFHCDLNSRPITPVHSSDYIFREERTSPYWPGQKVTVDGKMTTAQRLLPGKAVKSGTVLSVAAEELVVDWLTCCGGDPACMPPDVISASSGSVTALKYVASQPGIWHLGGRGTWLGPTTVGADGSTSASAAQDPTGAGVTANTEQSTAEATADTAGRASSDAAGIAVAGGMDGAPQNAVAGSTAAVEASGNVLGVISSGTEASSELTRPAKRGAPAAPTPGLGDYGRQLDGSGICGARGTTPSAATGRPSFAQVVKSGALPLDPQLQTKPGGSLIASPCTGGTPRSSASATSPHRGSSPGGNASSVPRDTSAAGGGAVGWVGSIANRILSLPGSGASPGGGQRRKRKPRNRGKKKDVTFHSSDIAVTALVTRTSTSVDLDWQDGRSEQGRPAVTLLPRHHLDDREFWPDDFVQLAPDNLAGEQPDARVGVVRSYNAADRTAAVAWLTESEDGWLQPLTEASPVETLPVYALEAHAHFSCCVGDVVIRLQTSGDGDSWRLLDNLGEICGTRRGCQRVLFASGEESYVMPDKMAILTRQDADSAEEEAEEEGWSQSSWSTCSGDDAASKGAEKSAPGLQPTVRPDDPSPAQPSAEETMPDAATPASALDGRAATAGDAPPPLMTSGGHADATLAASPWRHMHLWRQNHGSSPMAHDASTARAQPVSPPLPIPGNSNIASGGEQMAVEPEDVLSSPGDITFGSFDAEELGRICRAAKASQPNAAEDAPAGIWGMANRFFGGVASGRTAGSRDAMVADASSAPAEPAETSSPRFEVLERAAGDHLFLGKSAASTGKKFHKAVLKEWELLKGNLPSSIWMQAYETRMDLMRAAILGAAGTPYAGHLFFFDIQLPPDYPTSPPNVLYHSWGMRVNPNLYEEGRVCLSLLGTWTGHRQEMWTTDSTILQLVVSIQGLILVPRPYFNEAGFERQAGSAEGEKNAVLYNEQAFLLTTRSSIHCLRRPLGGFHDLIEVHYKQQRAGLLEAYQEILDGKSSIGGSHDGPPQAGQGEPSAGFRLMLQQLLPKFREALDSL